MKMKGQCTRPKYLAKNFGKMGKATSGRTRHGHNNGRARRSFELVKKMLSRYARQKMGPKIDELLQAGASGHKRARQNVETNSGP